MGLFDLKPNTMNNRTATTATGYSQRFSGNSIKNWRLGATMALVFTTIPGLTFSAEPMKKSGLEDERWFEVELIVFAHNNKEALESEEWPEISGLVLPEKFVELHLPAPEASEESTPHISVQKMVFEPVTKSGAGSPAGITSFEPAPVPVPMPVAFEMLKDEELQLKEEFKKLKKSPKLEPLLHVAWRQPTYDEKRAQAVLLYEGMTDPDTVTTSNVEKKLTGTATAAGRTGSDNSASNDTDIKILNPRFAGTVSLSVARYLHLAVDLIYRTPVSQRIAIPIQDPDLLNDHFYPSLTSPQGPAYRIKSWNAIRGFRLEESRRMRSKRIHYLDHPFFGVVVQISPIELPAVTDESIASDSKNQASTR